MRVDRFNAAPVLARLKDFQRRTVEYVVRRMYGNDPTYRFLIADEVGLGKTVVARGIIARALELLQDHVPRIDVVYVCSNAAIAHQNINRLNVTGQRNIALPTRLTMLPLQLHGSQGLQGRRVNFISFTPGTTFNLRSQCGIVPERAIIFAYLRDAVPRRRGLFNLLQGWAGPDRWARETSEIRSADLDSALGEQFVSKVQEDEDLWMALLEACEQFRRRRLVWPEELGQVRDKVIGRLRSTLARVCLDALEPDIVILDEFQRFKNLLHGTSEAAELAQQLFSYVDPAGNRARILLLSATPYRMLTLETDEAGEEDHYADFLETLRFLFGERAEAELAALKQDLADYRRALFSLPDTADLLRSVRDDLQGRLLKVMVRTERISSTADLDAMIAERHSPVTVNADDIRQGAAIDRIARLLSAGDVMEYWKSSPYLLSFMRGYVLKQSLLEAAGRPSDELMALIQSHDGLLLHRTQIADYAPLPSGGGRLRALVADVLDEGQWRHLWLPPSLPYWQGESAYAEAAAATKSLIFSAWNVVPDAIAALCSYEAERLALKSTEDRYGYFDYSKRPQLLRFSQDAEGRLTGMPILTLLYPSPTLAELADPLDLALEFIRQAPDGLTPSLPVVHAKVVDRIEKLLADFPVGSHGEGPADQRWYWAAPVLLDARRHPQVLDWCEKYEEGAVANGREGTLFTDHLQELVAAGKGLRDLGRKPDDLAAVLADQVLGSPAVCLLRALRRLQPDLALDNPQLLSASLRTGLGFRSLFNQHEAVDLIRSAQGQVPYWRAVLRYAADGNLQSVLDEYSHVLRDGLGLFDHDSCDAVDQLSNTMQAALSLRPAQIDVDDLRVDDTSITRETFQMRGRFAMRLAEYRDEEGNTARLGQVREAFNSPFRPFVLASTSVGQEGLDFHPYCHALYHWNLPSNPVDMEQREGRVNRYKGHAVRLNLAREFGLSGIASSGFEEGDPWDRLFELGKAHRPGTTDLVPSWIYERTNGDSVKVERRVPLLPFSREIGQLERLKHRLAVYRLAFGQPRQQELLEFLEKRVGSTDAAKFADAWRIDLQPPETEVGPASAPQDISAKS